MAQVRVLDGQFLIESQLGHRWGATLYRAKDIGLERPVMLKIVQLGAGGEARMERLRERASAFAAVRSDHLAQVYAFGTPRGACYVASEYVEGATLAELVAQHAARKERVPHFRALTILKQIASGLERAHARGLVHDDICAANVAVEGDSGRPVLGDVGPALPSDSGDGSVVASPSYAAPELLAAAAVLPSPASDVFAFACLAFELLLGRAPFPGPSAADVRRQHAAGAPAPSRIAAELAPLDDVFARALSRDPSARFPSATALCDALDAQRRAVRDRLARDGLGSAVEGARVQTRAAGRPAPTPADEPLVSESYETLRVLVADDDDVFRKIAGRAVQLALHDRVISLSLARSGPEALASAARRSPRLLIIDLEMPQMDGIEALTRLRAMPGGSDTRVLVVSARARAFEEWRFAALGVRDFLHKPVALPALVERVRALLVRETSAGNAPGVRPS